MNNTAYHEEPIEPFIWCVLAELHIPMRLCRQCKFFGGIDNNTIKCEYFYGNNKNVDKVW